MIVNLYRAIDKTEVQFDFIIHNENENAYVDEIKSLGGKIYVFPKFTMKNSSQYKKHWKVFLREHPEYRILHSHVRSYAIVFIRIAKKFGLKTIVHSHSTSNGSGIKARIKGMLQRPLRRETDYLFACSKISGEWLFGKKAVNAPNYRMIKNAIDTNKYKIDPSVRDEYRKQFNAENKTVYGHVGRLSEPKNHKFLLEIFADIVKKDPNSLLLIVGEGGYRSQIEAWISELNLQDSVIMTGSRSDIPQVLSAMDVFLFPSLWEGLPVTVVEAQAAGLPCLVSDKVTDEVAVSEAVSYLPIDKGVKCWVENAISVAGKRFDVIDDIKAAGFDVNSSAVELEKFYRSIYE
jgi:glycosyltransferase involved in cell wall biosynthesis